MEGQEGPADEADQAERAGKRGGRRQVSEVESPKRMSSRKAKAAEEIGLGVEGAVRGAEERRPRQGGGAAARRDPVALGRDGGMRQGGIGARLSSPQDAVGLRLRGRHLDVHGKAHRHPRVIL